MKEEIEIFLVRAEKFHRAAIDFFEKEVYDLAAFHIEQAFQLYLKYILAREIGYFPRTHSLMKLFRELSAISQDFINFYNENEIILKNIEDAYLLARYFPREYSRSEVQKMIEVLESFAGRFRNWITP